MLASTIQTWKGTAAWFWLQEEHGTVPLLSLSHTPITMSHHPAACCVALTSTMLAMASCWEGKVWMGLQ
jgi:hypothetical protein